MILILANAQTLIHILMQPLKHVSLVKILATQLELSIKQILVIAFLMVSFGLLVKLDLLVFAPLDFIFQILILVLVVLV
jgi:hypothetical protein